VHEPPPYPVQSLETPCQCPDPEHDCPAQVPVEIGDVMTTPIICTACLYGCLP